MQNIGLWACFSLLACISSISIASELRLNGISSYQELNKEYYIGALYLENPNNNVVEIESDKQHKQMKLLVTALKWSNRQWQKQWQNNIAINNAIIVNNLELQNDLEFFTGFLKGHLVKGDELLIDFTPGKGTTISLNRYPIMKSTNDDLFDYLLNTWIGKLPPSRKFKNDILTMNTGLGTQSIIARLEENILSKNRITLIHQWYEETPHEELNLAKVQTLGITSKAENNKVEKEKERLKLAEDNQERTARKSFKKEQEVARKKMERLQKEKIIAKQRYARKIIKKAKRIAALKLTKLKKEKEEQLEQYYFKDLYEWKLRQTILGEVTYPVWAKQFSQEGVVDAKFTVNRVGKVLSIELLDASVPKMLGLEVKKAIKKASVKTLPPKNLKGNKWVFSVSYRFNLKDTTQKYFIAPTQPKHLLSMNNNKV